MHVKEHRALREGEKEQNVVLQFTPNPPQPMTIACLWSPWEEAGAPELRGFAAITDEPPADVAAAGHDRCIINLRAEHVSAWLAPATQSREALQAMLSDHSRFNLSACCLGGRVRLQQLKARRVTQCILTESV